MALGLSTLLRRLAGAKRFAAILCVAAVPGAAEGRDEPDGLGPPPVYTALLDAPLKSAGVIQDQRWRIDRFEFHLAAGELFLLTVDDQTSAAVYLGDGTVRGYPPDGVEHYQVERFLDDDRLEESFDRFVLWFEDDIGPELQALMSGPSARPRRRDADRLLADRREALLEEQRRNPDSRLLVGRIDPPGARPGGRPGYFLAQIDGGDHGWFTIEIEPSRLEEVSVFRVDHRRNVADVWLGCHVLTDFASSADHPVTRFPLNPQASDTDNETNWSARDLGLSPRLLYPDREGWSPRVTIPRIDVDLALEGNGDARASVAVLVEPLEAFSVLRLEISRVLDITDVRWRPEVPSGLEDVRATRLLGSSDEAGPEAPEASEPVPLSGIPVHYVQETHKRRFNDDYYEPWVTVVLPTVTVPGQAFVVELQYEGPLVERLKTARGFFLKDTINWIPSHPHNRRSRFRLTYRVPDRYQIASGMEKVDESVVEDTRIVTWIAPDPVRSMSFSVGRFAVSETTVEGLPIAVYENRSQTGIAPGNLEKTVEDLSGSIAVYRDYFGPYPYPSLLVTETVAHNGQAFPGFVLLSYQAFGPLHTGEAELFRAHEVAHQWWGAAVHWENYRDQWLSEGFSHYAAALYALVGLGEEGQFRDILEAWHLDVRGEVNVGQGTGLKHYGVRPEVIQRSEGHESGPVVAGYRLNSRDTPVDYQLLAYRKGAFILHMLRMMLIDLDTGDDRRFRAMMREFVEDHQVTPASTRTFETAVTRTFGEPMDWFFDQWVYGVEVPTYRVDLEVSPVADQGYPYFLHGTVRQEEVEEGFRMPVPIVLTFDDDTRQGHRLWIDQESVEVAIPLPAKPASVEFNYQYGVLAHVR